MAKINQTAYEGRSATATRKGVVDLNQISAQTALQLASPSPIGSTTPNTGAFTVLSTSVRNEVAAASGTIGEATLVSGTVTIANTAIIATDRIFIQRRAANASTTLGSLSYTISSGVSFTINSLISGTPGAVETDDASTVEYYIVRQV